MCQHCGCFLEWRGVEECTELHAILFFGFWCYEGSCYIRTSPKPTQATSAALLRVVKLAAQDGLQRFAASTRTKAARSLRWSPRRLMGEGWGTVSWWARAAHVGGSPSSSHRTEASVTVSKTTTRTTMAANETCEMKSVWRTCLRDGHEIDFRSSTISPQNCGLRKFSSDLLSSKTPLSSSGSVGASGICAARQWSAPLGTAVYARTHARTHATGRAAAPARPGPRAAGQSRDRRGQPRHRQCVPLRPARAAQRQGCSRPPQPP